MNVEVEKATEAVKDAQKAMCVAVCKAYPMGAKVRVKLGGHNVLLEVVGIPDVFWSTDGQIRGRNIKTGKRRKFYNSDVIEVIKP